jgi:transcriptional regulator with XRE-family HTH domain
MFSGTKLRFFRYKAGRTQEELARAIGITSAYLSNVEHGKRIPSPSVMEMLARELSVRTEELWENDSSVPAVPAGDAEKGIILEYSKGTDKIKLVLPPTPQSYALIAGKISDWEKSVDPNLRHVVNCWEEANDETKKRMLEICERTKPAAQTPVQV